MISWYDLFRMIKRTEKGKVRRCFRVLSGSSTGTIKPGRVLDNDIKGAFDRPKITISGMESSKGGF
jgi:hypothetical protein